MILEDEMGYWVLDERFFSLEFSVRRGLAATGRPVPYTILQHLADEENQ
jgi:hypothetical protein